MGDLFKISMLEKAIHSTSKYESNDGRSTRVNDHVEHKFLMIIQEVEPNTAYLQAISEAEVEASKLVAQLTKVLKVLGQEAEIPTLASEKMSLHQEGELTMCENAPASSKLRVISERTEEIDEEMYDAFEEKSFYVHMHYGIKGQYLNRMTEPAMQQHKRYLKYGWESYVDLSESSRHFSEFQLECLMEVFTPFSKWDFRYMPEAVEEEYTHDNSSSGNTLGDFFSNP